MKHIQLIVLLLTATLLTACEQKPYQPPVPHTEPDKSAAKLGGPQSQPEGLEKSAEQASQGQGETSGKVSGYQTPSFPRQEGSQ